MNIICNNCNKSGHRFSECTEPVTSFGVLLVRFINDKPEILMINRKKSLCYIEFIRGKYNINDSDYIQLLIDKFSITEKEMIKTKSYDELWKDLWLIDSLENMKYKVDYEKSKSKFVTLREGVTIRSKFYNLDLLLKRTKRGYLETEWEFPKGRKNNNEKNINCATRECEEESSFGNNDYDLLINVAPLSELYMGENKIMYRHIYYIAILSNYDKEIILNRDRNQTLEILDVKWFSKDEALSKLRDYHRTRIKIVETIFKFVDNIEDYIII